MESSKDKHKTFDFRNEPAEDDHTVHVLDMSNDDPERKEILAHTPMSGSFRVVYRSPEDGLVYRGTFHVKRLDFAEKGQVGVVKAGLNGGMSVDPQTDYVNYMLAFMQQALIQPIPGWWMKSPLNYDEMLIKEVYGRAVDWTNNFRKRLLASGRDTSAANSSS